MTPNETDVPGLAHPTVVPANAERGRIEESSARSAAEKEHACSECGRDFEHNH